MEKKFLQKETRKLKNLNHHLDDRLHEQEKRLGAVSVELSKTWNLVGRMQRQHRQLHTHEQVLRYQLQQKRRMITEMKDELAYCRRKWDLAREKNNESQSQWDILRKEFMERKEQDSNASAESGYSDGPLSDDEGPTNTGDGNTNSSSMEPRSLAGDSKTIDTDATIFAAEVFQMENNVAESFVLPNIKKGDPIRDNEMHMEATSSSIVTSNVVEKAQISRASVCKSRPGPSSSKSSNVQKMLAKSAESKTKLCAEKRFGPAAKSKVKAPKEESLQEMFCRLSGQPIERESSSEREPDVVDDADEPDEFVVSDDDAEEDEMQGDHIPVSAAVVDARITLAQRLASIDERRALRAARIQCMEEQCKHLIAQVTRASNRGDALNRQIDEVQKRYTPTREIPASSSSRLASVDNAESSPNSEGNIEPSEAPSTSLSSGENNVALTVASENECLTANEINYTNSRSERLKQLEVECKAFLDKMSSTSGRASNIDNKLNDLHKRYGHSSHNSSAECASGSEHSENTVDGTSIDYIAGPSTNASTTDNTIQGTNMDGHNERLKCLDDVCTAFSNRVETIKNRATSIDSKLDDLRAQYGRSRTNTSATPDEQIINESSAPDAETAAATDTVQSPEEGPAETPTSDPNESIADDTES